MEGKRESGRKHTSIIDDLREKERYEDLKRRAEDGQEWRFWLPVTYRTPVVWQNNEEEIGEGILGFQSMNIPP